MNRLQKKCVIATVAAHLLLLTILMVGPAFYNPPPKPNNTQILDVIPANLVDAALNRGVRHAVPPAPAPVTPPPRPTPPTRAVQPAPKPVVTPPPTHEARVERISKPEPKPESVKQPAKRAEPHRHQIHVNTTLVTRPARKHSTAKSKPDNSRRATRALNNAIQALRRNLSPGVTIDMPGDSSVAAANYASAVKSVYERALTSFLPSSIANDNENTKVSVSIASDGTVISSSIISRSGDPVWDAAVQHTLDRVTYVAPFPAGSTDKQRHYIINFNPQVERTLQ